VTTTPHLPMLVYASTPKNSFTEGYAPNHSNPPPPPETETSEPHPTSTTPTVIKQKPTEFFIPVFAEAVPDPKTPKPTELPTDSVPVETGDTTNKSVKTTSTTPGTTEAPKPGLIYVDTLARDVQAGLDGLVKNLPDILKGAKEAIALLGNLREIFGEEDG